MKADTNEKYNSVFFLEMEMNRIGIRPPKEVMDSDDYDILLEWLRNQWDTLRPSVEKYLVNRVVKDMSELG